MFQLLQFKARCLDQDLEVGKMQEEFKRSTEALNAKVEGEQCILLLATAMETEKGHKLDIKTLNDLRILLK